jgi:hypothetical protein
VGSEAYMMFEELFKKNNTKLLTKVNIYLEWEKKSQHITNLKKKLTNTTYITKTRKKTYFY